MLWRVGARWREIVSAERVLAIVGTRKATSLGVALAEEFARAFAEQGVVVVSGGARGIDTAAHRGAIAGNGRTVVVLPTPLCRLYPAENTELFRSIAREHGALVSEFDSDTSERREHFVQRNDWIAALSDAVVIVEAGSNSGALHTARAAEKAGLPVAVVPWSVRHMEGVGCNELIAHGARLVTRAEDVFALLDPTLVARKSNRRKSRRNAQTELAGTGKHDARESKSLQARRLLRPLAEQIHRELGEENLHTDDLCMRLNVPRGELMTALLELELAGLIELFGVSWRIC